MLDAEVDEPCGAGRYQRSADRVDTRAGSYGRTLHTSVGKVMLKVPKLRQQVFETAIIERYRRREASVEESLIEMYRKRTVNYAACDCWCAAQFHGRSSAMRLMG